jgi:hypothetical protein
LRRRVHIGVAAAALAALALAVPAADAARLTPSSKLSTAGLGPVKIGMTVEQAERAGGLSLARQGPEVGECRYVRPRSRRVRVSFMTIRGRIARVDVFRRGIRTLSGFTVGAREAAVRREFGSRLRVRRHQYVRGGHYLEYVPRDRVDRGRRVIFETNAAGRVTYIRAGRLPEVRYIEGCS